MEVKSNMAIMPKGNEELGKMLKRQRLLAGLTLKELGTNSGVSPSQMSRIERGQCFPSVLTLRKLGKTLDLSESELFLMVGYFLS